jgi:hypothetical protein
MLYDPVVTEASDIVAVPLATDAGTTAEADAMHADRGPPTTHAEEVGTMAMRSAA